MYSRQLDALLELDQIKIYIDSSDDTKGVGANPSIFKQYELKLRDPPLQY